MNASTEELAVSFRLAMRRLAATVTIITTSDGGIRHGMTATAVTSVCADPPSLLFCVNQSASIHAPLKVGSQICINLLKAVHTELSQVFSGKLEGEARFAHGRWDAGDFGVPYLADAQANIFGHVEMLMAYGTHSIYIARVTRAIVHPEVAPLVYQDGVYATARPLPVG
ncbi:flavin reductase family protein [Desertibaculum subflavum]|uniref:flavin reductase family protein n=1 Tax=Desertibaculum subflavum TaxID=2268458 RepID=UPI0034D33FEC